MALIGTSRPTQRQKIGQDIRGPQNIGERTYNEAAGAIKQLPILGHLIPFGPANLGGPNPACEARDTGQTFAFFNTDTALHYVAISDTAAPSAPTSAANGIPLPPGQYTTLAMREALYFISDSTLVFAYWIQDETDWK